MATVVEVMPFLDIGLHQPNYALDHNPKEVEIPSRAVAMKMDLKMIIVCSVVGSLGVLSAILGFSAEGTKLTVSDLYVGGGLCLYPQNPALGLGVCAVIFLVVAQIVFAVVGGCCGCCRSRAIPSETNRIIGVVCAVFSWIMAIIAFALLVTGAAWNTTGARDPSPFGLCYVLKDGIFAGGAVLTLVATALGLTSYVMLRGQPATATSAAAAPKEGEQMPAGAAGTTMRQPQFPQQPPQGQGTPNYPQYSPPPQGQGYGQPPNPHHAPPPAQGQGYGAHAPNQQQQQQLPPPPARRYGQYPPPKGDEQV
ncbi:uncharacterized protein LOC119350518 [Triticum dicoccoides]|uniref:uncharacterized protein LOC119350518 n=1 Tax=Triticum dicoccoides TaxID=85692 RepID=UPI00188E4296|nr:uncharacterized protein LOC119350518 [Triticum dicoccoides]